MAAHSSSPKPSGWTIAGAEALLLSLPGIGSVRIVAKLGGEIDEVHLLTTQEVSPKQTVRNVESALLAQFGLSVDHRKISVAQTSVPQKKEEPVDEPSGPTLRALPRQGEPRILFMGLHVESQRSQQVRFQVELEWRGERHKGEAAGADLARARMDTVANAALRAIEAAAGKEEGDPPVTLALDGVKVLDAFDRHYVLVAVHAMRDRQVTPLSGTAMIEDSHDKAVILATLQATDRWVRARA